MLFEIGHYQLEIDVEKTRQYYSRNATYDGEGCPCQGCRNFKKAVGVLPKEVSDFFDQFGVDIAQPMNITTFPGETAEKLNCNITYDICGEILSEERVLVRYHDREYLNAEKYHINEDYYVWFEEDRFSLDPEFPRQIVRIEMMALIPFVLDEEVSSDYIYVNQS